MRHTLAGRIAAGCILATAFGGAAIAYGGNDLRGLRLGMTAQQLPTEGLTDFTCAQTAGADAAKAEAPKGDAPKGEAPAGAAAAPAEASLKGFADYASCPKDAAGLHGVGFRYDDATNERARMNAANGGTKVGGHPVILTMLIGDDGIARGLRIVTDPHVPPYQRKKAFLLATQVKVQFGDDGWTCTDTPASADAAPIGDLFIRQRCEKTTPSRHFEMQTSLYRRPGDNLLKDMVNETSLTIMLRP